MYWYEHEITNGDKKGLDNGQAWMWDNLPINRAFIATKWSTTPEAKNTYCTTGDGSSEDE